MATIQNTKSTQQRNTRYVAGGQTDVFVNRLGWWERKPFAKDSSDTMFVITSRYSKRPDLLAADVYGKDIYMWVILQYNTILDINTDFVEGKTISLPQASRVLFGFLS